MGEILAIENSVFNLDDKNSFPLSVFPNEIGHIIQSLHNSNLFSVEFVAMGVLGAISTSIGNSLRVKVREGYIIPSHMFLVTVADRGSNKSAPIKWILAPLRDINKKHYNEYELELAEYKVLKKDEKESTIEPHLITKMIGSSTKEVIIKSHRENPRGFLRYANELKNWFGSFNAYGNGNSEENFWCDIWDGEIAQNSTVGRGHEYIHNPCVGILGTIQPSEIGSFIKTNTENGLMDRILFCYPEQLRATEFPEKELDKSIKDEWYNIYNRIDKTYQLYDVSRGPDLVKLSPAANKIFLDWNKINVHNINSRLGDVVYKGIIKKHENNVFRIALTLEVLKGGLKNSKRIFTISENTMAEAIKLTEYFTENIFKLRKDVGEKSAMSKQDVWYSQLPNDEFTTAQAYEVAKQTVKVSTRTVDTWLTSKDFIKGDTNGKYTKNFEI